MKLVAYVRIWFVLTLILGFECYALNFAPGLSLLGRLKAAGLLPASLALDLTPGKTLSLWLGWTGVGVMLLTNLYSMRKRIPRFRNSGRMNAWLDFHIFCGLTGPVLILFHTNFKVGGLVALSFWCMVISFCSGVVGRYFYLQLVQQRSQLLNHIGAIEKRLSQLRAAVPTLTEEALAVFKHRSLVLVGVSLQQGPRAPGGAFSTVFHSMAGDLRIRFGFGRVAGHLPPPVQTELKRFALSKRRLQNMETFRRLMGYWHSFHAPFAIFMYVVAAIHIVSSLIFMVGQ